MDVWDSLLDVEWVSDSMSDGCEVESVGLLLLLVLGVELGEIDGEGTGVHVAVGGRMRKLSSDER